VQGKLIVELIIPERQRQHYIEGMRRYSFILGLGGSRN